MKLNTGKIREIGRLLKETAFKWYGHNVSLISAGISFYTLISLVPLLIFILQIANMFFQDAGIRSELYHNIQGLIGEKGLETVKTLLENARNSSSGWLSLAAGIFALVFGASHVFGQLNRAIDMIWGTQSGKSFKVLDLVKGKFLSFLVVIGIGLMITLLLLASASQAIVFQYIRDVLPGKIYLMFINVAKIVFLFLAIAVIFAFLYKYLPDRKVPWRNTVIGAVVASLLFSIGRFVFEFLLLKSRFGSVQGIAGSVIFILIWIYLSAQIFFLGAELTRAYTKKS